MFFLQVNHLVAPLIPLPRDVQKNVVTPVSKVGSALLKVSSNIVRLAVNMKQRYMLFLRLRDFLLRMK